MPLKNYRLLVGKATDMALDDDSSPHIEIQIDTGGQLHRIAVNVRSSVQPSALLYNRRDPWNHPLTDRLALLSDGRHDLDGDLTDLRLDYVRGGFITQQEMAPVPFRMEGPDNDLKEFLIPLVENAIADPTTRVYAFGESWGPEDNKPDAYFSFLPGRGIHDIHMNQGSTGGHAGTNGASQDGALVLHMAADNRWVAVFLAFQSQTWQTDAHGNPAGTGPPPIEPTQNFDGTVGIVAALVNPPNPEEGRETVTLLNRSDGIVDLTGWSLVDTNDRTEALDGMFIGPGEALRVHLTGTAVRLTNKGASLRLVDVGGTVVHQVEYRKGDVGPEGWSLVF